MKAAIFGAAGYGGVELVRILLRHPQVEPAYLADPACERLSNAYPHVIGLPDLEMQPPEVEPALEVADFFFFCLQP
ncbi:MAG: N-acetyl-gamma-glutamyl-phosphate reductase, partial [Armatimonadota bacterium]